VLDVALNEDDCRIRKDNAPENFAVCADWQLICWVRKSNKRGVKNKQFWQRWITIPNKLLLLKTLQLLFNCQREEDFHVLRSHQAFMPSIQSKY